ncbi:MAG: tRNA uridine-5-carboxymethylaminomethyl(34) synthesis GTPase MnmE, partial [Rhodospirillales bacterium]|nr:tRNA uridine-5-carboxymethylaminomethyl(34) synthesis GTPase MnmE [Rhodospirillales bacterium]
LVTRLRHRESLASCVEYLARALTVSGSELWAEDLRLAMRELGSVVGQVGVEDLLDVIFSEFCIGK